MGIDHKQDYAGCIIPLGLEMTWTPQEEQDDTTRHRDTWVFPHVPPL